MGWPGKPACQNQRLKFHAIDCNNMYKSHGGGRNDQHGSNAVAQSCSLQELAADIRDNRSSLHPRKSPIMRSSSKPFALAMVIAVACAGVLSSQAIHAQTPPGGITGPARGPGGMGRGGNPANWANPTGPYAVTMQEDDGKSYHTVYHPTDLGAIRGKKRLPIVIATGPGCEGDGTTFRPFYTEVASHGFLVVSMGPPGGGSSYRQSAPKDLTNAIDWAVAENTRADSKLNGKLDASKVAVFGQSCGGAQALYISDDPRIKTIVMYNSTSFVSGPAGRGGMAPGAPVPPAAAAPGTAAPGTAPPARVGGAPGRAGGGRGIPVPTVNPERLHKLKVPIAYVMAGTRDILYGGSVSDIPMYDKAPLFWSSYDIGGNDPHAGTFREMNGGLWGVVGVAWLKYQFNADSKAARMFKGANCTLCKDPKWEVRKKNMK
jgi:hypothetical protein